MDGRTDDRMDVPRFSLDSDGRYWPGQWMIESKTKDREKRSLADGICCWTCVSLNKMPRTDGRIDMDPALAGRMSLSRFGQGMEWIEGLHKEQ
ncbi:hypothetical protein IGI04_042430 [Brassica rapa subsp. trilocularis]|uniref:Uncharacterized protein n=1 Tax=Brassica rapa subsp. trilocularis TaxID=1813537 RepID=A0ABQ7KMR1_BRACM|nr:hypothetical protein IGI04_042430 [Brassica rapa subsp. trilocularis]